MMPCCRGGVAGYVRMPAVRAVVYEEFGGWPEVRQLPDPVPPPGGVLVRVGATGLCRSDWHGWRGDEPGIVLPHVPGHEFAGRIAAVGAGVAGWQVGDRVTAPFVYACGGCPQCLAGDQQVCPQQTQPGFTQWGSFAEYVTVDHAAVNLIRLPDEVDEAAAALLGCRFATAFRAVLVQGRAAAGEWVAVYGCGGVGLSAIMIAVAAGARVVAVDVAAPALALARRLGADSCLDASTAASLASTASLAAGTAASTAGLAAGAAAATAGLAAGAAAGTATLAAGTAGCAAAGTAAGPAEVAAAVRAATGGGAHVSIDALGSEQTCVAAIEGLRRRGRHVQVGLLPANRGGPVLPMDRVIGYELEIYGSHGMPAHAYPRLLGLVAAGVLRPAELVTGTLKLADVPAALTTMDRVGPAGVRLVDPR
jgi:D-arabinose 1-dehydrogenase-like Zn-dependent alcohol dehydrogenase